MINININAHSSIRIEKEVVIYFDPFMIEKEKNDADIIFITHDHFDHFSIEDIKKVTKKSTVFVCPKTIVESLTNKGIGNIVSLDPYEKTNILRVDVEAIPSYNVWKPMHKKKNKWLGYVITIDKKKIYVVGDSDNTVDAQKVKCDIILIPVGGYYTMDYKAASKLVNTIMPKIAIPTHYGSLTGTKEDGNKFSKLIDKNIKVELLLD